MPYPDMIDQHLTVSDLDIDVVVSKWSETVYGVNEISFDQYEFDESTKSTKCRLTAPNVTEVYSYRIAGKMFGHKVLGEGVARTETIGYGYVLKDLRFEEINRSLQISVLELSFVLDDFTIDVEDLYVDGMSVQQLEKLLEIYVLSKAKETKEELSRRFAAAMKKSINEKLSGHSTEQIIQWLKEHTNHNLQSEIQKLLFNGLVRAL